MVSKTAVCEVRQVCKVAKKKSTCTAVVGGDEKNPPSSSSAAAAAVMKKKKKNKGKVTKCSICLQQYKSKNLDKHMHSRSHHEAIERLKGGEQTHKCWACDVSMPGMELFRKHIECKEHISKLMSLQQRRESGFAVDYKNNELSALCAQRDQNRLLFKMQKNKEKLIKMRERKAAKIQEAFHQKSWTQGYGFPGTHAASSAWSNDKSVGGAPEFTSEQRAQSEASFWQASESIRRYAKEDVDFFTSDSFPSWEDEQSQQVREQKKVALGQKRSCDANTSSPLKKQCSRDVPSMVPRLSPSASGEKVERASQSASSAAPLRAPGQDHLSRMLKDVRKTQSLRDDTKSKRTSCPRKPEDNLPTSTGADPQEKPEPSQNRNVLPTLLSRSVSKTEANKPNLKAARGIRTAHTPSQAAKTRVLKPTLQKLISSKSSQWRVNWKEMYQEATHRRLQREKGLPRFGIELVSPLPPDPQEEDLGHLELDEGFQWASIECDAVTLPLPGEVAEGRDRRTSAANRTPWLAEEKKTDVGENPGTSGTCRSSELVADRLENGGISGDNPSETRRENAARLESAVSVKTERSNGCSAEPTEHDGIQAVPDTRIKQEKKDFPNLDTLNKNLPKGQVNDLLVMSLREVELCSSLEDLDSRLLRAQDALQTAFLEVQQLQMIKQQVTAEMSSLRSKRINILNRIKKSSDSRLEPTPDADSAGSAVETHPRAAAPGHSA